MMTSEDEILQNILDNVRLTVSNVCSNKTVQVKQLMLKIFFDFRFKCNIT